MDDCIFCKIIKGEIPSYKVYEDEHIFAFLDIKPLSKGHTLVLPKGHYKGISDIPEELLCEVNKVSKRMVSKIQKKFSPLGFIICQNNGESAGQTIHHYHLHIKPVYEGTVIPDETDHRRELSKEEMNSIVNDLIEEEV
ncbi:MAG: HIT family protein [candidate division WS6 bacterium GW2011_GWF1_35_23]|uniref:HIT family protein n=1 Tax=candidate division WS6 bacterium GW2011_GWF1_35_23 TaxID=1619097 RepID=A0A0G0C522_9BACT|nr:MAG: HIT family protein [candidate division WS6 bacterium GW2011_GWF1_35_23]